VFRLIGGVHKTGAGSSAISLAECLNSLVVSLLDDHAVLTLEDMVSLGKIGGNVVRQIRALEKILLGWVGTNDL
jgi:hypothetical protein